MKKLIYFLMTLMGFGFTNCEDNPFAQEDAYGCPYTTFRMTARVVDEAGNPIEGIGVGFSDVGICAYSDVDGYVEVDKTIIPTPKEVSFIDEDGEANGGEFETLQIDITDKFVQTDKPSGDWHDGDRKVELGDVTMVLKDSDKADNE